MRVSISLVLTSEEQALLHKFSDEPLYERCQLAGTTKSFLTYVQTAYHNINLSLFHGSLHQPTFYLLNDTGPKFKTLGLWTEGIRKLGLTRRLFNGKEIHVLTTLTHEMCHQAVSDIDKVRARDQINDGHGPEWERWMNKVGLTPSRYSKYDLRNYMNPGELDVHQATLRDLGWADDEAKRRGFRKAMPKVGTGIQFWSPTEEIWIKGLIVGPENSTHRRWRVLHDPAQTDSYMIVPKENLYQISNTEFQQFLKPEWIDAGQSVIAKLHAKNPSLFPLIELNYD